MNEFVKITNMKAPNRGRVGRIAERQPMAMASRGDAISGDLYRIAFLENDISLENSDWFQREEFEYVEEEEIL
jgi:hypothetical protein